LTNGELLRRAIEKGFEVFLTGDQSLQFQQNLSRTRLGVVVLSAASNKLEDLLPLVSRALAAISGIEAGQVVRVAS